MMRVCFLWIAGLALNLASYSLSSAELNIHPLQLFAGNSQSIGTQLWQTDQTPNHTKVFSYLTTTPNADANFYPLGTVGKYGLFAAFSLETGQELWRTDGSSEGTELLKDLEPGTMSGLPRKHRLYKTPRLNLKDRLIFWGQTADQLKLYSTDGSRESTLVLASFPYSSAQTVNTELPDFYPLNEQAFFWVDDGIHGLELWRTDGSSAGTQLAVDASTEPTEFNPLFNFGSKLLSNQNSLFFISEDQRSDAMEDQSDYSLWRVDGKTSERLKRFTQQSAVNFSLLAADQNKLIWIKTNASDQQPELWQFDLKTKRAHLILHLPATKNLPRQLSAAKPLFFKHKLYWWFVGVSESGQEVDELWTSDFTAKGTEHLVSLPNPNYEYKAAPILFSFANRLYFFLNDGVRPSALWLTDGTVAGTKNLLSVQDSQYAGGAGDSWPDYPTPYVLRANKLIFSTFSPKDRNRSQIWSLTPEQPEQPLLLGEFDDPQLLPPAQTDQGSLLYFLSGKQRWQTDGTISGTKSLGDDKIRKTWEASPWPTGSLTEILALPSSSPSWIMTAADTQTGQEPWLVTTAPLHSKLLKDINTAPASANLKQVQQLGSTWYFVLNSRLWATQADPATLHEITELPQEEHISFNAQSMVKSQDTLYFITEKEEKIHSLWQITAGQLKRIKSFPASGYIWLFPSHQGVYVAYYPPETTADWTLELWKNQTQQFTTVLKKGEDQRRLATLLETEQGLLYILEPNYALGGELVAYKLVLHTQEGTELVLKDGFEPIPSLLTDTLFASAKQTYFLTQKENDPLNYQLSRLDWTNKTLVAVKTPPLPQQSRVLAAKHGLFILSQEPEAHLWWLADDSEQAELIKKSESTQYLDAVKLLDDHLYFHVMHLNQDAPPRELWLTDGSSAGTQKLHDDLEMLRD